MNKINISLLAMAAALTCAPAAFTSPALAQDQATAPQSAHDRLFQLFRDSDEASLKRNPIGGIFRGDLRYADHLEIGRAHV